MKRDTPDPNPGSSAPSAHQSAPKLSQAQIAAIAAIGRGESYSAAAKLAGVDRATLWRWRHENADFAASLDGVLQSIRDEIATGLVTSAGAALASLHALATGAEDEGVRLKASTEILNRVDGAAKAGTVGAAEAAVTVQVMAADAAAELRRRRESGE